MTDTPTEQLHWKLFVHPMPVQRKRFIQVTNMGPGGQIFFDPSSHYLFRETQEHNKPIWHVAELPCNKGKPRP